MQFSLKKVKGIVVREFLFIKKFTCCIFLDKYMKHSYLNVEKTCSLGRGFLNVGSWFLPVVVDNSATLFSVYVLEFGILFFTNLGLSVFTTKLIY